jgi:type I restriction enzyme S subunit
MAISQSNYAVSPIDKKSFFFLFRLMNYSINDLQQRSYGTVFDTITTKTLKGLQVIIPPENVLTAFEEKITPLMYQILNNLLENQVLAKSRDLLLPKLMSGEIEV